MKSVIIIGTGGHAKVILDILQLEGFNILGFLSINKKKGSLFCAYKVLGGDEVIDSFLPNDVLLANGIGALPRESDRWEVSNKFRNKGFSFLTIIHPSAVISSETDLFEGVQVMAGAVIQPGAKIGRDTIINSGAIIDHDCIIEENCHIAPGTVCSGNVKIGSSTHIGTGSSIIQNISIGKNCIVAAGSVVFNDVKNGSTLIQIK